MKHAQAIAILLDAATGGGSPAAGDRRQAEEHVARCSDCWAVVSRAHEQAAGTAPAAAGRMEALYGCAPVQDSLHLLAGLGLEERRAAHPALARHLDWCHACAGRLAEVLAVEETAARGEVGPPLLATSARWREVAGRAGGVVRELVGRIVVEARRAGAAIAAVPDGVLVMPGLVPAEALRGAKPNPVGDRTIAGRLRIPLDDHLWAEIALEPHRGETVGLALGLALEAPDPVALSVHVSEIDAGGRRIVARQSVDGAGPVVFPGVPPGRYVLEIHERHKALVFALQLDVEPGM